MNRWIFHKFTKKHLSLLLRYAPIGILFLIAGKIVEMEDITAMGGQLGMYTVTVVCGLLIHAIVVLPTLYFVITRKNPFVFIAGLLQALITALGTSSRYMIWFSDGTDSKLNSQSHILLRNVNFNWNWLSFSRVQFSVFLRMY